MKKKKITTTWIQVLIAQYPSNQPKTNYDTKDLITKKKNKKIENVSKTSNILVQATARNIHH